MSNRPFPTAPLFEIPSHADKLHLELAGVAHGGAVPRMNGGKLRSQPDGALLQHLLGQVGVLHIHEIPRVKPADFLEHIGAHGHKAAGAELDAAGHGQILILHRVVVVGLLKAAAELRGQLPRQQQPGRRLAARQVLQLAVRVTQLGRCHGGPGPAATRPCPPARRRSAGCPGSE